MNVGLARGDLTVWEPGVEMLGWGQPTGRLDGVDMPLHVRALVFEQEDRVVAMVSVELCFVSQSLRDGVLDRLAGKVPLASSGLVITANHTHSGPGGFMHRLLYLLSNAGYVRSVYEGLVERIAHTIIQAWKARVPGRAVWCEDEVPTHEPVAFNRAMSAYRRNPEANTTDRSKAVDRRMRLLRLEATDGRLLGVWTWFAVHGTSLHHDHRKVHPDNKGIAAAQLEDAGVPVAAFAQAAAGDVSPNHRFDRDRRLYRGYGASDLESVDFNGGVQFHYARKTQKQRGIPIEGPLDARLRWVDFHGMPVSPTYAGGTQGRRTARPRLGLAFIEGTGDGPGPLWRARWVRRGLVRITRQWKRMRPEGLLDPYGGSFPFLEVGTGGSGLCFGSFVMGRPMLPSGLDPIVDEIHRLLARHADVESPWMSSIAPVQVVRIGTLAVVALPCEPTTTAGARIEAQVLRDLPGVQHVVIQGYSNAYHGYLTTREEYAEQRYEGAHTAFGQWSLAAYRTVLDQICRELSAPASERPTDAGQPPKRVEATELTRRAFAGPPGMRTW